MCNGSQYNIGTTIAVPWTNDDQSRQLVDQIAAMVARADVFFTCYTDYLGAVPQSNAALIDEGWRRVVALWMISVVDYYNLDRNIVSTECFHQRTHFHHPILSHGNPFSTL